MYAELEMELLNLFRQSSLADKVRIDSLPDTNLQDLVQRWGAEAPALYVTPLAATITGDIISPRFAMVLVVKNASSHQYARYGDGLTIGLYPLLDSAMALIHHAPPGLANWKVDRCEFLNEPILRDTGLFAALIEVSAETDMPAPEDLANLADFTQFNADYDIAPHSSDAQHQEWANGTYDGLELPDLQSHTELSSPKEST